MSQITKNALATALKKLLSKKELSKITISNITEECGVNRQTFYYHFKDIYDLLEWIFTNEVIEEIDNEIEENWQQKFIYIFEYVIQNKEFIKNVYSSGSKEYFYKYGFVGVMEEWIETGMKEKPQKIVSKLNDIIEGDMEKAIEKLSEE